MRQLARFESLAGRVVNCHGRRSTQGLVLALQTVSAYASEIDHPTPPEQVLRTPNSDELMAVASAEKTLHFVQYSNI